MLRDADLHLASRTEIRVDTKALIKQEAQTTKALTETKAPMKTKTQSKD